LVVLIVDIYKGPEITPYKLVMHKYLHNKKGITTMSINNKKEIVILLRLRQVEDYLEKKIQYFGKTAQDLKLLIIIKNTIQLLKQLDDDASDVRIDPDEFSDLKDSDLQGSGFLDKLLNNYRRKK